MTDRHTPSTNRAGRAASYPIDEIVRLASAGPSEPAVAELDLRDHHDAPNPAAAPAELKWTPTVHEAPWDFLSRRQAADRFGLDAAILSQWEKAGELTPHRKTPRGRVYYSIAELKRTVSEHGLEGDRREPEEKRPAGLLLSPERLWEMVEEAREDALHARMRASTVEAEVRLLREMLQRMLSEPVEASGSVGRGEAAERARRWAGQWEQHERQQQEQQRELASRGSWWSRDP
jgi:hypothetical protein